MSTLRDIVVNLFSNAIWVLGAFLISLLKKKGSVLCIIHHL
jgi:hypothetical protein